MIISVTEFPCRTLCNDFFNCAINQGLSNISKALMNR
jgi:hypothetical protein